MQTCETCKWWSTIEYCHRFPPQMVVVVWPNNTEHPVIYTPYPTLPSVASDYWCGEHKEKEKRDE